MEENAAAYRQRLRRQGRLDDQLPIAVDAPPDAPEPESPAEPPASPSAPPPSPPRGRDARGKSRPIDLTH